ncbi:hypothetical protein QS257_01920 [Terrilactibacillus sp. S3-3]|nr:hypothetical protein QS257_01920 [Terrilactibacillus sp. S3-3]
MIKARQIIFGIVLGVVAGIINIVPLAAQKVRWDTVFSQFLDWVIVGFFIAATHWKINDVLKGILIALLIFIPSLIYTIELSLAGAFLMIIMTAFFGGLIGAINGKLNGSRSENR